jgi:hypothetical protein
MKHWQWFSLALSPLLLVVALVGVRSFGGSADKASAQAAQIVLDLDEGTGWCNTIETTDTVATGLTHEAAICLTGSAVAAANFNIVVNYTSAGAGTNTCSSTGQTGAGLDANPDFIVPTGSGWDCSSSGNLYPKCGETAGRAEITCGSLTPGTPSGNWAIAVIEWTASGAGGDNLSFGTTALYDTNGDPIVKCADTPDDCIGATVTKTGTAPVPTATSTATPTATSTPSCGRGEQDPCPTSTPTPKAWTKTPTTAPTGTPAPSEPGEPAQPPPPPPPPSGGTMPQVVPPATGTGSGGVAWTTSLMWTLAGAGALSVFLGGLYLRRARNR